MQGKILSSLMKEKGVVQKDVAKGIGVSQKTVSRWVTGEYLIPTVHIRALAKFFVVDESVFNVESDIDTIICKIYSLILEAKDIPSVKRSLETSLDMCMLYKKTSKRS